MNIDAIGAFSIVVFNVLFWSFTFGQKRFNPLIWAYFGWCLFISLWAFGYGVTLSGLFSYDITLIWNKYCQAMATLIGPFFFKFAGHVVDRFDKYKIFFKIYFVFGIINALGLFFTDYYVKGLWSFGNYVYQPLGGSLYIIFTLFFIWCTVHAYIIVALNYKAITGIKRKHVTLFLIATGVAYSGGVTLFLQGFKLEVPTSGVFLILVYVIIIAYSIQKYKFMDIEVIIKRTIVFAGIVGATVIVIAVPIALIQVLIGRSIGHLDPFLLMVIGIATTVLIYRPVAKILVNVTDKFLFQKKEDAKVVLNRLAHNIVTILDLGMVARTILSTLKDTLRPETGAVLVKEQGTDKWEVLDSFGIKNGGQELVEAESLKLFWERPREVLNLEDESKYGDTLKHSQSVPAVSIEVRDELRKIKASILIPLFLHGEITGMLILGKKKSDQEYTQDEIDYFPVIAGQTAIALSNARLMKSVVEEREAKVKAEHLAERVKFARTVKHEIKNALAGIEGPMRLFSMYHLKDLKSALKEKDEEWFSDICKTIEEQVSNKVFKAVQKVFDITETSVGGLDKDDQAFRKTYFKILWDEAKEDSGVIGQCDFASEIPDGFTIYGKYHALQRIFVNLITNAYDAMKNQESRQIKLRCSYKEVEGKETAYFEFEDNGPGIPDELKEKIFEQGFSTKPKPDAEDVLASGYGQGLYACKVYVEKIHHGKIWVEKAPEGGALFKFWIPNIPEKKV